MTPDDQGEYDCIATNTVGQGSNTAVLNYIGNNAFYHVPLNIIVRNMD